MASRRLLNTIKAVEKPLPPNKKFLQDVMRVIEQNAQNSRIPSQWYKPSGLGCIRGMYYTRVKVVPEKSTQEYNFIGMADTGTRRHEAIQEALLSMKKLKYDWEYLDVEKYVKMKQAQGKCLSIKVAGKRGVETHLYDTALNTSFMCDGIIKHIPTEKYYLFEFKNQVARKTYDKQAVDLEHHNQVICYCTSLDLEEAFVMYENRDMCFLECPEVFQVTQEMKDSLVAYIMECESYVEKLIVPPKPRDVKCMYCNYKAQCRRDG